MESVHGMSSEQSELVGVVRGVRNRYGALVALSGAAITLGAAFALFAISAYAMNAFKYSDGVVITARVVTLLIVAALAVWFIVLPLRPKLRDEQVALYLEEHERTLNATVVTAVEMRSSAPAGAMRSPALIDRLTRAALDRVHRANDGRTIDQGELRINGGILATVAFTALAAMLFGPVTFRHGVQL